MAQHRNSHRRTAFIGQIHPARAPPGCPSPAARLRVPLAARAPSGLGQTAKVEAQPDNGQLWTCRSRCVKCWKPACTSATRPATGTRRWRDYIFGHRNKIHIVNLEKTMRDVPGGDEVRAPAVVQQGHASCSSAPSARRARSSRKRRSAAACPTSTIAGSAACSPTSRPSSSRSSA